MATRSIIGMVTDSSVKFIYCHWDGYPDHHLPILVDNYNTNEMVEDLISLGGLSILAENISAPEDANHTFDKPLNNVCVFYTRDRGENWEQNKPQTVSLEEFTESSFGRDSWVEYKYLFQDGFWDVFEVDFAQEATV